jgi:hypothetical protein
MSPFVRRFFALFAGTLAGMIVMIMIEALGMMIFPAPSTLDVQDPAALAAAMDLIPLGAKLMVVLAWVAAPFAAGALAARLHPEGSPTNALAIGGLFTFMGILNLMSVPHPLWMAIPGVVAYLPAAWAGDRVARPAAS